MQPLIDFLNHGFLPFVGRTSEVDRIVGFWRSTIDAHALRAALLLGEAGVGKSRFVEELMPRIAEAGGAVAHLKFYPESNSPVAPLAADALWRSVVIRGVLKREPEPTISSVADALRRLARLRATLLVIEDIHLLGGDSLREFAALLSSIADEPLSILCVARPVELEARGVIEPYLIEELELKGLALEELCGVWRSLFNSSLENDVGSLLIGATRGNALALRSALRAAVSAGVLAQNQLNGVWEVSTLSLAPLLERNLDLLVAGMAAHLTPAEREAAGALASLGELFARETASALLDDAEQLIGALLFKGILVTSSTSASPLPGDGSERPLLVFTHTLIHRYFVSHVSVDRARLVKGIAAGLPLYSILPFDIIAHRVGDLTTVPLDEIRRAIDRALLANQTLDNSSGWKLGRYPWMAAAALFIAQASRWSEEEWTELLMEILYQRLLSLRRSDPKSWEPLVALYLRLTEDLSTDRLREERFYALRFLYRLRWERDTATSPDLVEEMQRIVERHPELRFGHGYIYFLGYLLTVAVERNDVPEQRRIEREVEELIASEQCTEKLRSGARKMIGRSLINLFESPEELAERFALLDELLLLSKGEDILLEHLKLCLLFQVGEMRAVIASRDLFPRFKEQGLYRSHLDCHVQYLCAEAALGGDIEKIIAAAEVLIDGYSDPTSAVKTSTHMALHLLNSAILSGKPKAALATVRRHIDEEHIGYTQRIALALATGDDHLLHLPHAEIYNAYSDLPVVVDYLLERGSVSEPTLLDAVRALLASPVIRLHALMMMHALLSLIDAIEHRRGYPLGDAVRSEIEDALERSLRWLDERALAGWMQGLLDHHGSRMSPRAAGRWRARIEALRGAGENGGDANGAEPRLKLAMLGTIGVEGSGVDFQGVRGSRLRALLGLMVANLMQRRPLEREEFWVLAGGTADDPTRSRKTMNQGVLRLRELLGRDAILTDADVPRLNLDTVQVDLLDAARLLTEASDAAREGALVRARTALAAALDLVRGDVPFPTLYDDFFEAAREEFENLLRGAVIEVGEHLLREGDAASAEEVLTRGLVAIPEDEEMAALLQSALKAQGKHVESARVRLKMAAMG